MFRKALILALGACLAQGALAGETLNFDGTGAGLSPIGWGGVDHPGSVNGGNYNGDAGLLIWNVPSQAADPIGFSLFGLSNFDTVCGDLDHYLFSGQGVMYSDTLGDGTSVAAAGSIVEAIGNGNGGTLSGLSNTASFDLQIATWCALYSTNLSNDEASENTFVTDLFNGGSDTGFHFDDNFVQAFGAGATLATAEADSKVQGIWADFQHATDGLDAIFIAQTDGGQSQIGVNPGGGGQKRFETPEPFTMSLGLAGIGLFIRRRSKNRKA